jgi:nicotinamidase/pyrazinamidase
MRRLEIDPETDALIVVDPQMTFMMKHLFEGREIPGGGLGVKDGHEIIPRIRELMALFPKENRYITKDRHPYGHVSLASSFKAGYALPGTEGENQPRTVHPFQRLTYDDVKGWTEAENGIAPHALFSLAQLKAYLKEVGSQDLWPDHAVDGTEEAEIHPGLSESEFAEVVVKGMNPARDSYSAFHENGGVPTGLAEKLREKGFKRVFFVGLAYDYCVDWSAVGAILEGFEALVVEDAVKPVDLPGTVQTTLRSFAQLGVRLVPDVASIVEANRPGTAGAFHEGTLSALVQRLLQLARLPGAAAVLGDALKLPQGHPIAERLKDARAALNAHRAGGEAPQVDVLTAALTGALGDVERVRGGAGAAALLERATREAVLAAVHVVSNAFVSKLTAEEAARVRSTVESFAFARLAETLSPSGAPAPEAALSSDVQVKRVSEDGRSVVLSLRTAKGVAEVRVQAAKDMPFGTLFADDGTHIGATWRGPTGRGLFSTPGLRWLSPPAYTITLQPETLANPALLYQALLEDLGEIKAVAEGADVEAAHEKLHPQATGRGLAYDLGRRLSFRERAVPVDPEIVPSVGKQLAEEMKVGRLAETAERLNNNVSFLGLLAALTGRNYDFAGLGVTDADAAEFLDLLRDSSARTIPLSASADRAAFDRRVEALARLARELDQAYRKSPQDVRNRYAHLAAGVLLAAGAAGRSSEKYGAVARRAGAARAGVRRGLDGGTARRPGEPGGDRRPPGARRFGPGRRRRLHEPGGPEGRDGGERGLRGADRRRRGAQDDDAGGRSDGRDGAGGGQERVGAEDGFGEAGAGVRAVDGGQGPSDPGQLEQRGGADDGGAVQARGRGAAGERGGRGEAVGRA